MKRKAFTLIELLVVIAIISLLVSILLPSLSKAKEMAKSAVCLCGIRHSGMGVTMYMEDNNQEITYYSYIDGQDYTWNSLLYSEEILGSAGLDDRSHPYESEASMTACPDVELATSVLKYSAYGMAGYSQYRDVWWSGSNQAVEYSLDSFENPGSFPWLADSIASNESSGLYGCQIYGWTGTSSSNGKAHARHLGKINVSYADGHSETVTPERFRSDYLVSEDGQSWSDPFYVVVGAGTAPSDFELIE